MGLFSDLFDVAGDIVKTTVSIATGLTAATVAVTLGVSEYAVKRAMDAGCKTVSEIEEFLGID